jgi:quinol-cytochrome oxidoreductase complex cytochrome b subunit
MAMTPAPWYSNPWWLLGWVLLSLVVIAVLAGVVYGAFRLARRNKAVLPAESS